MRSTKNQGARININVGPNTTIVGLGGAKITGINLILNKVDNVIVRNVRFEDAYDCFPSWDPTDGATGNWNSLYDTVSLTGATHVWVDHTSLQRRQRRRLAGADLLRTAVPAPRRAARHHQGLRPGDRLLQQLLRPRQDDADRLDQHGGRRRRQAAGHHAPQPVRQRRTARAAGPVRPGRRVRQLLLRHRRGHLHLLVGHRACTPRSTRRTTSCCAAPTSRSTRWSTTGAVPRPVASPRSGR